MADFDQGSGGSRGSGLTAKEYFLVNISKCFSELIGTAMVSYYIYVNKGRYVGILFSYWIITLFAFDISGAHFNPCITLAQMFRKNSNFGDRRLKGILYIIFQFLGALLAAFACATFLKIDGDDLFKKPSIIYNYEADRI